MRSAINHFGVAAVAGTTAAAVMTVASLLGLAPLERDVTAIQLMPSVAPSSKVTIVQGTDFTVPPGRTLIVQEFGIGEYQRLSTPAAQGVRTTLTADGAIAQTHDFRQNMSSDTTSSLLLNLKSEPAFSAGTVVAVESVIAYGSNSPLPVGVARGYLVDN